MELTTMRLIERPASVDLKWSDEDRRIFLGADATWRLWHEWAQTHEPTDEQLYRKLLMDLFFDYRNAYHLGGDFDTLHPAYDEFNRCKGKPIESMEDYVSRILPLLDYDFEHRENAPSELGTSMFRFIVTGNPASPLPT